MKRMIFFFVLAFLCLAFWVKPREVLSQTLTDSTVNFYTLSAYYDHYYDSLIQLRGAENMQGTGYKDYLRWKWFYTYRHSDDGDIGAMWDSIVNYYDNLQEPENYVDESDWQFMGPLGIPLAYGDDPSGVTGKGMMLSLWVSEGDHSLIYAGSHHGGLWKTTDGGDNWYPMHDKDPRINGVSSIAVDPVDHNTLYITCNNSLGGFSQYSSGLFKSTDGGINWYQLSLPGDEFLYPTSFWGSQVRKIMIQPDNPNTLFFITYRNVFRSDDKGNSWDNVFQRDYFPWGGETGLLNNHNGFFDFKFTPWTGDDIAYLAGSEIYRILDPLGNFNNYENISDNVFQIEEGYEMINHPSRCEISMDKNYPNVVWFCY